MSGMERYGEVQLAANAVPGVSVDNLIFAVHDGQLKVVLGKYKHGLAHGCWGLIGHWIFNDESLEDAAARVVKENTGVENLYLEQLATFGQVDRYPLRRVLTVAYYSLIRYDEVTLVKGDHLQDIGWFDVRNVPELIFDHSDILQKGYEVLRYKVRREPIGFNLLPEKFTLLQLQGLYEAMLDITLDKSNFRRKINKMNLLIKCNEKQQNVPHRAAALYRFDEQVYHQLKRFGFNFDL